MTLPQTMKAAVVHACGAPLRIEEVKVPLPGPGQVLVKIEASGVCHTDLHAAEGDWPVKPPLPFIPGHEGVGYVAAVGSGVTRVKEGDRVGILAVHRLRLLRALPDRLGDPLREPAEHRLLGERRLCRIRIGRPELRRNSAEKRRIR